MKGVLKSNSSSIADILLDIEGGILNPIAEVQNIGNLFNPLYECFLYGLGCVKIVVCEKYENLYLCVNTDFVLKIKDMGLDFYEYEEVAVNIEEEREIPKFILYNGMLMRVRKYEPALKSYFCEKCDFKISERF